MSVRREKISAWDASSKIRAIEAVRAYIATFTDDEQAIRDTLEGETDIDGLFERLIRTYGELTAEAEGLASYIETLVEKKRRRERQAAQIKELAARALKAADRQKWSGLAGTAFLSSGRLAVRIENEALIPEAFLKVEPDRKKISDHLNDHLKQTLARSGGDLSKTQTWTHPDLPGAALVRGEPSITIKIA